jgi:GNAT superfamily N-acetyltransferase
MFEGPNTVVIRAARMADIPGLIDVHIASWRSAYREQVPDQVLADLDLTRSQRQRTWSAVLSNDRQRAFVAERNDQILGFVNIGPARPPVDPTIGEVYAIYLNPNAWDQGLGRALFATGEKTLRSLGYRSAILWMLATNLRARKFYEAAGWRADGETKGRSSRALDTRRSALLSCLGLQ